MVDRKYTETLPGPFPDFSGGAWGRGYVFTGCAYFHDTGVTGLYSLASQTQFRKRGKGLVNCVYKSCPTGMQLAG